MRISDWSSEVCSSDLLTCSARARKFGRAHRVIVKVIFRVALAKGCCRGEVGAAQVHADNRLQSIDILAGTGRRVPGIAEAILGISPREAWRAGGDGNLIMNRRGRQPLGLGHDDRVDGSALDRKSTRLNSSH